MKMTDTFVGKNGAIWAGVAATLLLFLSAWIWRAPSKLVPYVLVGDWRTTDPNYGDRTFEIDPVCVTFTTGDGTVSVGFIKAVKEVSEGSRILYTISYTLDGEPNQVSFYYDQTNGNTISFKNQTKVVWKKDQDS
jgi:hypothetical protein